MISSSVRSVQKMGKIVFPRRHLVCSNTRELSVLSSTLSVSTGEKSKRFSNAIVFQSNQTRNISLFALQAQKQQQHSFLFQTRCFSFSNNNPIDYFELFGLPRNFGIDPLAMKQTYLRLMNEHHPDKQLHQQQPSDEEPLITAETITHAYQILKQPHTRALHWLELHGSPLEEASGNNSKDESSFTNQQDLVGMEFLMEIMEWREAIEDAGADQQTLEKIQSETRVLHEACEQALEDLLEDLPSKNSSQVDAATLDDARQLTAQLQYWHRLEKTLKEALEVG